MGDRALEINPAVTGQKEGSEFWGRTLSESYFRTEG